MEYAFKLFLTFLLSLLMFEQCRISDIFLDLLIFFHSLRHLNIDVNKYFYVLGTFWISFIMSVAWILECV
jgi:hypothetical protein